MTQRDALPARALGLGEAGRCSPRASLHDVAVYDRHGRDPPQPREPSVFRSFGRAIIVGEATRDYLLPGHGSRLESPTGLWTQ